MVARPRNEPLNVQTLPRDVEIENECVCVTPNEATSTSPVSARALSGQSSPTTSEIKKLTTPWRDRLFCWRWRTSFIVCFGFVNILIMRNAFNIALVCMTGADPEDVIKLNSSGNVSDSHGEFDWDADTRGIILSAVQYLAFAGPSISGFLARRFGVKRVVAIGMGISTLCHMLTPVGARIHVYVLIGLRVLLGSFSGQIFVGSAELWQRWAPNFEKVQLVALALSGVNIGSFLATYLGFMCKIPYDNGWPFLFYSSGLISVLWLVLWMVFIYDEPDQNPWISQKELAFIKRHISHTISKTRKIPWRGLLTSLPLWSYAFIQACHMWTSTVFFVFLPMYMRDILSFSIEQNSVLSSLPYASRFIGVLFWTFLSDTIRRHTSFSVTTNRKLIQSLGYLFCAVTTVGLGYADRDYREVSVFLFMVAMFCQSCSFASFFITPMDIAPSYVSVIVGSINSIGVLVTVTAPSIVGVLTRNRTIEEWRVVFYIVALVYVVGLSAFIIFGSGEIQPWAIPEEITMDTDAPKVTAPATSTVIEKTQNTQNELVKVNINDVPSSSNKKNKINCEDCEINGHTSFSGKISVVDNEAKICIPTLAGTSVNRKQIADRGSGETNMAFDGNSEGSSGLIVDGDDYLNIVYTTRL